MSYRGYEVPEESRTMFIRDFFGKLSKVGQA